MPTAEAASFQSLPFSDPGEGGLKAALRVQARGLRRAVWRASGAEAAIAVAETALAVGSPLIDGALAGTLAAADRVVAGYWPVGFELDGRPLLLGLSAAGWALALPVVTAPDAPLAFRSWRPDDLLVAGGYGIPEPAPSAPLVRPAVVLVPLLAFDRAGHRLGQGAGHYDRTLAALRMPGSAPVLAVGLAFAAQEVPAVPASVHDQRLDWIVTEQGAIRGRLE